MVAITLDGVTVRYSSSSRSGEPVDALDDLSLDIGSGELLVLAGPSGSGKTTVLRTIAGLEHPLRGVVRLDGRVANQLAPGARDVALVNQFESLFPHLTVEENLGFALRIRHLPPEETTQRVEAEARVLGLWSKLRRHPRQLSNGERQKAALGRATTRRPGIYLLDEPLAGVDAGEREHLRRELQRLQRGLGVTTVYVTHDQRDAMALGDRIAVLDRGRLVQVAEPLAVYRHPANLFVAGFFGSPPMGLIRGPLRDDGSTAWIDAGGGPVRLLPAQRAALAARDHGRAVVLGARSHAVHLGEEPQHEWSRHLDMVIRGVEPLGPHTVVAMTAPDATAVTADRL
ncbi:MAG TPA: ABC transporter ATP-binding protein, partial [Euzebyales bacterium]|nr:ABC transporter ATP-binding protein [Euzebyales bacterium]